VEPLSSKSAELLTPKKENVVDSYRPTFAAMQQR